TISARPVGGNHLRLARRRQHHRRHEPARGDVELPDARRAAGAARSERLLARPPLAPREHQQDQGDRPLVQSELHPEDEGRESDRNPGEPHADAAPARVPEAVIPDGGPERPALHAEVQPPDAAHAEIQPPDTVHAGTQPPTPEHPEPRPPAPVRAEPQPPEGGRPFQGRRDEPAMRMADELPLWGTPEPTPMAAPAAAAGAAAGATPVGESPRLTSPGI